METFKRDLNYLLDRFGVATPWKPGAPPELITGPGSPPGCAEDQCLSAPRAQFRSALLLFDPWDFLNIADQFEKLVSVNKVNRFAFGEVFRIQGEHS